MNMQMQGAGACSIDCCGFMVCSPSSWSEADFDLHFPQALTRRGVTLQGAAIEPDVKIEFDWWQRRMTRAC